MKLYFRFIAAVVRIIRGTRLTEAGESVLQFRVWPTDLDSNLHLNNARYLALMDLGRIDLVAGMGMLRIMFQQRLAPVVGAVMLRFRRGLDPWMRFTLRSRLVGWDEKWFYFEQRFERDGDVYALGFVRLVFRARGRSLHAQEVAAAFGLPGPSPDLPDTVLKWRDALDATRSSPRAEFRITA